MSERPRVVLLAAVEGEIRPLRLRLAEHDLPFAPRFALSGVGKAAAACEAALAIERERPCLLVQVGCAGAFPSSGLRLGDVVMATEDVLGDEGVETDGGFLDLQALGFPLAQDAGSSVYNVIPAGRLAPSEWEELCRRVGVQFALRAGRLLTVSAVTSSKERQAELASRWQPLAESMEGAAAALAALRTGCEFLEVRGISNHVGRRDRRRWELEAASEHAAAVAASLLELKFSSAPRRTW